MLMLIFNLPSFPVASLETSFSILTCSCSNGLILNILSCAYWPFIYFLWGNNQILHTLSNWVVFLLRFKNYMFWYKSLFIYIICKYFLTFWWFHPFCFPYAGFLITEVLNIDQVQFIFFVAVLLVSYLRHKWIVQGHNNLLQMLSSVSFIVLVLTFGSFIHFELVLSIVWGRSPTSLSIFPGTICWRDCCYFPFVLGTHGKHSDQKM